MESTVEEDWVARTAALRVPASTPRPEHVGPTLISRADALTHLWGDDEAGDVADWVYSSSQQIHHLVFGLAPNQWFRHSPSFRTVFAADEVLYVLQGSMALCNPQTGEVVKVEQHEAAFFRRDTWHHAFSLGPDELRVLELFAPPPATGSSSAYAKEQTYLTQSVYTDGRWTGRWPAAHDEHARARTIHHVADRDYLWSLEGSGAMVGTIASTEHLSVAEVRLGSGVRTGARKHAGDAAIHVVDGVLFLLNLDAPGQRWFEAHPGDGLFVPAGVNYELRNVSAAASISIVGTAPTLDQKS